MDYSQVSDEGLIGLVCQAQNEALGALYDRYARLVFGVALHITGETDLAEEITQDVFLRVWEHATAYRPELGKVGGWLAGITRHRAIDIFRHHKTDAGGHSQAWEELPLFDPPDTQDIEMESEANEDSRRIRQALAALPIEQQQTLTLAYFRGYTQEEIAEQMGQPLGTVKTRMRLGMQKLRKLLEEN